PARHRVGPHCRGRPGAGDEQRHEGGTVSQFEMVLRPNRQDEKTRPLALEINQWAAALRYSRAAGYAAPDAGGMSRSAAGVFAEALRTAVQVGRVPDGDR